MKAWLPAGADVLVLMDTRWLSDANRDAKSAPEPGQEHVHSQWPMGKLVWGRGWDSVARVALFEFAEKVDKPARLRALDDLASLLSRPWRHVVVLQSRSKSAKKSWTADYAEASHSGTFVWRFFDAPAGLKDMAGTHLSTPYGTLVGIPDANYTDSLLVHRWLCAVRDNVPVFLPPAASTFTEPGPNLRGGLARLLARSLAGAPIACDIESFSTKDLITVIGLSDGETTCAVPWEAFTPYGQAYVEAGLSGAEEGRLVRRILASARKTIFHNGVRSDIPYLARKGVPVPGEVFDTYLAHGILANQYRHGLQQCVAAEFAVQPWKSFHTASVEKEGLSKEDAEAWIQDPKELRAYNASDTYYTWWLGQALARNGGVSL